MRFGNVRARGLSGPVANCNVVLLDWLTLVHFSQRSLLLESFGLHIGNGRRWTKLIKRFAQVSGRGLDGTSPSQLTPSKQHRV
jgi:hypothetical protein